jgi:hypothetical protein
MGRFKNLSRAIEALGDAKTHRNILKGLAKEMNLDVKVAKTSDAKKEIQKIKIETKPSPFTKRDDLVFKPEELIPTMNTTMLHGSRLFWLREVELAVAV